MQNACRTATFADHHRHGAEFRRRSAKLLLVAFFLLTVSPAAGADRRRHSDSQAIASRIKREPVVSSALVSVGYSKRLRALEIEFRDGSVYRYREVPRSVYRELLSADSKARFFNQQVRRKFAAARVKPRRKH